MRGRGWAQRVAVLVGAGALSVATLVAGTAPAGAAPPTVRITQPASDVVFDRATIIVGGSAEQGNGVVVNDIVYRAWLDPDADPLIELRRPIDRAARTVSFAAPLVLERNGDWTITVTATGEDEPVDIGGPEDGTATVEHVLVEAPPAAPTGLQMTIESSASEASVSWEPNREPDLLRYEVERQTSTNAWEPLATVEAGAPTVAFDESPSRNKAGEHAYRVTAVRPGAISTRPVMRSGPAAVSLNPATGTTSTTTPAPAGGGSGPAESGGNSPGGSSGSNGSPASSSGGGTALSALDRLLLARGKTTASTRGQPPDPGFQPTLPFTAGPPDVDEAVAEDGPREQAAGESSTISEDGPDQTRSLAFFAGGLLATVLLMHSLWIRGEVARAERLEPLPAASAGDAAAGCAPEDGPDR